ncbi:MAG TPA: hypothetical protein VFC44_10155 [Candidatus Saccharimonadales bacterium]|nr:hypothetical protein [Candidatus Saccharimonadales bacterium]
MLDHLRRWKWALATVLIGYFTLQVFSVLEYSPLPNGPLVAPISHVTNAIHNLVGFQVIIWLGFLLLWDIYRGLPRVLTAMPVTAKQIGHTWWLVAVGIPAVAIGTIGCLAILIFGGANTTALFRNYWLDWADSALYLGAEFGAATFIVLPTSGALTNQAFNVLPNSLVGIVPIVFIALPLEGLSEMTTMLILAAGIILFSLGCLRTERMVLQRATSKSAANDLKKQPAQYKIPEGFGGLPYLARKTLVQTSLIGLAMIICVTLAMSFLSPGQSRSQAISSMMDAGSVPYAFVILGSIIPVVFQLRLLRALPVFASTLSATLVLLPVCSLAAIGLLVITMVNAAAGQNAILTPANDFLFLGAKAALMVPLVVWRGLDAGTYILAFLLVACGSLVSIITALSFHLGKIPEQPLWLSLSIFFLSTIGSILLTHRLLTKSSAPYRARVMPLNLWNMVRR